MSKTNTKANKGEILTLPLTRQEANALLRLIAVANSQTQHDLDKLDRQTGTWVADRILRLLNPL